MSEDVSALLQEIRDLLREQLAVTQQALANQAQALANQALAIERQKEVQAIALKARKGLRFAIWALVGVIAVLILYLLQPLFFLLLAWATRH